MVDLHAVQRLDPLPSRQALYGAEHGIAPFGWNGYARLPEAVGRQLRQEPRQSLGRTGKQLQHLANRHRPVPTQLMGGEDDASVFLPAEGRPCLEHRARHDGRADFRSVNGAARISDDVIQEARRAHGRHDDSALAVELRAGEKGETSIPLHEPSLFVDEDRSVCVPVMGHT